MVSECGGWLGILIIQLTAHLRQIRSEPWVGELRNNVKTKDSSQAFPHTVQYKKRELEYRSAADRETLVLQI